MDKEAELVAAAKAHAQASLARSKAIAVAQFDRGGRMVMTPELVALDRAQLESLARLTTAYVALGIIA
jgi:hypothetical protein